MKRHSESGNVIFFILLAIVLIGLVTVAIRSGGEGANIDKETVAIRAAEIRQYASELERGIAFIMQQGVSETAIRFAHPDAPAAYGNDLTFSSATQMFGESGGGAEYRLPPADISGAANWEFYGNTHAPGVGASNAGDERPELIAVLPYVSKEFCDKINDMNGQIQADGDQPEEDTGACELNNTGLRFAGTYQDGAVNILVGASFNRTPAMQACVKCDGPVYHFYHVLLAR